ncbi:MAG: GtrA family protein [Bryobacteraceae bacterium]
MTPSVSRSSALALALRWLKFNAVGAVGIGVQLAALWLFKSALGLHYLVATALAVELAVLHNFVWHELWTWRPAARTPRTTAARLARFNLTTGLISIASNLLLMRLLVGTLGLPYLHANLAAIALTNIANFAAAEWLVFGRKIEE